MSAQVSLVKKAEEVTRLIDDTYNLLCDVLRYATFSDADRSRINTVMKRMEDV